MQVQCAAANAASCAFMQGSSANIQVEAVERQSVAFIAAEFGDEPAFQQQLLDWIWG